MRKVLLGLAVVIIAVPAAGYFLVLGGQRDKSTKVDRGAVAREAHTAATTAKTVDPGLRPMPGLYEYAGSGTESVSILGGSTHEFPKKFSAIVKLDEGCEWTLKMVYLEEKSQTRHYCTTEAGTREIGWTERITFFGTTEEQSFTCPADGMRVKRDVKPGATWTDRCKGDRRVDVTTSTLKDIKPMVIDGESIADVRHVLDRETLSGVTVGSGVTETWYLPSGLQARIASRLKVRSDSLAGETDFTLNIDYTLVSTTPKT